MNQSYLVSFNQNQSNLSSLWKNKSSNRLLDDSIAELLKQQNEVNHSIFYYLFSQPISKNLQIYNIDMIYTTFKQPSPKNFIMINSQFHYQIILYPHSKVYSYSLSYPIAHPLFKGNFTNYYYLPFPQEITSFFDQQLVTGIFPLINCAYFAHQNQILFWHFSPETHHILDLNKYFNPSDKCPFPSRVQIQTIGFIKERIMALAFGKYIDQNLLAIATNSYIHLARVKIGAQISDIQNIDIRINTDGELIHQMVIYKDSLYYGGSSGQIKKFNLGNYSKYNQGGLLNFGKKIADDFKKGFGLLVREKKKKIIQLEIDNRKDVCYALVENYVQGANDEIQQINTHIMIYDLNEFKLIQKIKQEDIRNQLQMQQLRRGVDLENLQFFHIKTIYDREDSLFEESTLMILTKSDIKITLVLLLSEKLYEYKIKYVKYPIMDSDLNVPYGVFKDESRWNNKAQEIVQLDPNNQMRELIGCYCNSNMTLNAYHEKNNILLIGSFNDHAHLSFEKHLQNLGLTKENQLSALQNSLYKECSREANEFILLQGDTSDILGLNNQSNQHFNFDAKLTQNIELQEICLDQCDYQKLIQRKRDYQNQSDQQMYLPPTYWVCLSNQGLYFLIQYRPIDILFMCLKVTHIDYLGNTDVMLPLEKMVRSYGLQEIGSMLIQIMIKQKDYYYINVDFEKDLQLQVNNVITKQERIAMQEKFFEDIERTPIWVVGRVYRLQGLKLLEKAKLFYQHLIKRHPLYDLINQQRYYEDKFKSISEDDYFSKSVKAQTFLNVIKSIVKPIWQDKLLGNLDIKEVLNTIGELKLLLESDSQLYLKPKEKNRIKWAEKKDRRFYSGFDLIAFEKSNQEYDDDIQNRILIQDHDIEKENQLMHKIYLFNNQVCQILNFFLNTEELNNIIYSQTDNDRNTLTNMTLSSLFSTDDQQNVIVIRMLITAMLKNNKHNFKEQAKLYSSKYPTFFDEYDYRMTYATNEFENLILQAINQGYLGNENQSFYTKIKRLIARTSNASLSLEKILNEPKILIYYQELPESFLIQLNQTIELIKENVTNIKYAHFKRAFKHFFFPFALFPQYFNILFTKAQALNQVLQPNLENEYKDCINDLADEIKFFIELIKESKPYFKLNVQQLIEIFDTIIIMLGQYKLEQLHLIVIRLLYQAKLRQYIVKLNSPYLSDCTFEGSEFDKIVLLYLSNSASGNYFKTIEYSLKFALFSFMPEYNYERIIEELNLQKRIDLLDQAIELVHFQLNKEGLTENQKNQLKEYQRLAIDSKIIFILQQEVYKCVEAAYSNQKSHEYQLYLQELVRYQYSFDQLKEFIIDNDIHYAFILVIDYEEFLKKINYENKIQIIWELFTRITEKGPCLELKQELKFIYENLIDKNNFYLNYLIKCIEEQNCQHFPFKEKVERYLNDQIEDLSDGPGWLVDLLIDDLNINILQVGISYWDLFYNSSDDMRSYSIIMSIYALQKIFKECRKELKDKRFSNEKKKIKLCWQLFENVKSGEQFYLDAKVRLREWVINEQGEYEEQIWKKCDDQEKELLILTNELRNEKYL